MKNLKKIIVSGTINGKTFVLNGKANTSKGIIWASYKKSITKNELHTLSMLTFTGCPSIAKTEVEENNPWVRSNGVYKGERSIEVDGKKVVSSVLLSSAGWKNNTIEMKLEVKYSKDYFDKHNIEIFPSWFQEEMKPCGKYQMKAVFSPLARINGGLKRIKATTIYTLPEKVGKLSNSWRDIFIGIDSKKYSQLERIMMYC